MSSASSALRPNAGEAAKRKSRAALARVKLCKLSLRIGAAGKAASKQRGCEHEILGVGDLQIRAGRRHDVDRVPTRFDQGRIVGVLEPGAGRLAKSGFEQ